MRNRIKQLFKKEEGFTLVELLGVIVILGIIVAIAIPMMGNVIANAKEDTDDIQDELVMDAAQLYFLQNKDESEVTVDTLIDEDYLEEEATYSGTDTIKKEEVLGNSSESTESGQ